LERKTLKNKPLVEAIFELRWNLQEPAKGLKRDPHYKIIVGTLFEKLKEEYPFHEQLPAASMPDEIVGYFAQHRFRKDNNKWPLIQIGPGIITVNDTEGYIWEDFEKRIIEAINTLFSVYPDSEKNLIVNNILLRYIDAIDFNFEENNVFTFLKKYMKTNINLYPKLFLNTEVEKLPLSFDWRFSYRSLKPKGELNLRYARGKVKENDALIWETIVKSEFEDIPEIPKKISEWLKNSHKLTDDWFFKLIEGELLQRFE